MAYVTETPQNPVNQGDLTAGNVERVEHNPNSPSTGASNYPNKYPSFVQPTNAQMTSVLVEDEAYPLSKIDQGNNNRLDLQHQPVLDTSIVVSDGVINTALTDYEHGFIYFSTLPTGPFTVQYLANPDKYYGEYLNAIQDVIHMITWLLGAGSTLNEGIKNAEIFLDSLPAGISSRMPNAICLRAIDRDILIASSTDPGDPNGNKHTITLGNGDDDLVFDAETVRFKRGIGGSYTTLLFGDESGDFSAFAWNVDVSGLLRVGIPGQSANPGISAGTVQSYENTGLPYINNTLRMAVHGDAVIYGDLVVFGTTYVLNVTQNIQVNVYEEDIDVGRNAWIRGTTRLGSTTADYVAVAGSMGVTGGLDVYGAGGAPMRVDGSILFTNGALKGSFEQSLVDGLDPSYWACVQEYLHSGHKHETVFLGERTPLFEGTVSAVGAANILQDTAAPASLATAFPTGLYYAGKFADGDFFAIVKSGANQGARVPVRDYNTGTKEWTLARDLDETLLVGDAFAIVHEANSTPGFIVAGVGLSITVRASTVYPLVGWKKGKIKVRTSNYDLSSLPDNSTLYIFMTAEPGVNGIDEDEPTFLYSTSPVPNDWTIPIGKVVTAGGAVTSVTCYALNLAYDTLWVKVDTAASGNTIQAGSDWTLSVALGDIRSRTRKLQDARILVAPDSANAPDKTQIRMTDLFGSGYYVKTLGETSLVLGTPSGTFLGASLPYWVRFVLV